MLERPALRGDVPSEIRVKAFVAPHNFCVISSKKMFPFKTFPRLFAKCTLLTLPGGKIE